MLAFAILGPLVLTLAQQTPPLPVGQPRAHAPVAVAGPGAIRAVVVKSWSSGSATGWPALAAEWPSHGSVPVVIDTETLGPGEFFTYEDLVASAADVVILSDPAGGQRQFSAEQIAAVRRYATEGHNLIATYKAFRWNDTDNRELAPLFGLPADFPGEPSRYVTISNVFHARERSPLLRGLLGSAGYGSRLQWVSTGYAQTEAPSDDDTWNVSDLAGARIVAQCDAGRGIVSVYKTATYAGIFISNMPEYVGGFLDRRLLYNAIVYPRPGS